MPCGALRRAVLFIWVIAGSSAGLAAEAVDRQSERAGSTALRRGPHGETLVNVSIAGHQVIAMLDTGSTHTSISANLVQRLNLPLVARSAVRTSTGVATQPIAQLDRLMLAGVSATGVLASVVSAAALDPIGRIEAVVGQDVLAMRRFTLDYVQGQMFWSDDAAPGAAGSSLELEFESGRFVVTAPQTDGGLRLVPDSGAEALVLYGSADTLTFAPDVCDPVWVETVSGRALAQFVVVQRLQIGPAALTNVRAAILPSRRPDAPALDGLLPLSLFSRVVFDGPNRRLFLER